MSVYNIPNLIGSRAPTLTGNARDSDIQGRGYEIGERLEVKLMTLEVVKSRIIFRINSYSIINMIAIVNVQHVQSDWA